MTFAERAMANVSKIDGLAAEMTEARKQGALYHVTNPVDTWFCTECSVFGRATTTCWSCLSDKGIKMQWVPRFGGGAQSCSLSEIEGEYVNEPLLVSNGGVRIL